MEQPQLTYGETRVIQILRGMGIYDATEHIQDSLVFAAPGWQRIGLITDDGIQRQPEPPQKES